MVFAKHSMFTQPWVAARFTRNPLPGSIGVLAVMPASLALWALILSALHLL